MRISTIMVVDDEEQILDFSSQGFAMQGYNVLAARNAEEAIEMLHDISCSVFFIDLHLPGMNGIELCKYIRQQFPLAIPFAVTGYASIFELAECRDAGFEDYFTKPVALSELFVAAESACHKLERWQVQQYPAKLEDYDCLPFKESMPAIGKDTLPDS
jgi:CheY-like chemotaxis protein